ncbi:Sec63-domain-containing protein [Piromyces finnis]|uniref:Sec63-domain-containing protein n=1 Tax=Piromyces finnis TaxID=1754191 RepID=A0A1Y1UVP0_9FUNG|nr:Sec63-domain-containing protein [Piromyces finnis]|eukprot:ORX42129.1 Sec63-domain-containing protein [Piromyces finnis]
MLRFTDLLRQELSGQSNLFAPKILKGKGKAVDDSSNSLENNLENTELLKKLGKLVNYWKQNVKYINEVKDKTSIKSVSNENIYGKNIKFNVPFNNYLTPKANDNRNNENNKYISDNEFDSNGEFGIEWLEGKCQEHVEMQINEGSEVLFAPKELTQEIIGLLSNDTNEQLENSLVDLLGFGNFELISILVQNKDKILKNINRNVSNNKPKYGTQFTVTTEDELQNQKKQRKLNKHHTNMLDDLNENEFTSENLKKNWEKDFQKKNILLEPEYDYSEPQYPNVYSAKANKRPVFSSFGNQYVLPQGTIRNDDKDYEEIIIPIVQKAPERAEEKLIPISSLDEFSQKAFKGIKQLNRVQSIVFPIAFHTNENMLVAAPTGAGKTNIAMLAVLNTILKYYDPETKYLDRDQFKIVYVAPMKALAAEIVRKFSERLGELGITVKEYTGDMQLTKSEIAQTQMIVTTPEKWDVVTRKTTGDTELVQKVRLLIIDEVHLLHDDRGSVIESIVARTQRQVEMTQSMIRIIGLSATLPNYVDVAEFLKVNLYRGMFYFDDGFRPVPLGQTFIGVKGNPNSNAVRTKMDNICFEKVIELVKQDKQVMIFVHSRKETVKTAQKLREYATNEGVMGLFDMKYSDEHFACLKEVQKSRNNELKDLYASGLAFHNAGMLRSDRNLVEKIFAKGAVKVLVCTATLAWGVNLPAYAVIIKGTRVYGVQKGSSSSDDNAFFDLSILDVLQIFGRAGRPGYEDHGLGYILTTHDKLSHYIQAITQSQPIESRFGFNLVDNLNAEITLGTVTNIQEAVSWLSYTFYYVRLKKNPLKYGLLPRDLNEPDYLIKHLTDIVKLAAKRLHQLQMIIYANSTEQGYLTSKDLGRIASLFYINNETIEIINEKMKKVMTEADIIGMICHSKEFENVKLREEELTELEKLEKFACICDVEGGVNNYYGKVNILLQTYISRENIKDFALISDSAYVAQHSARIARAMFEIAMNRNWGPVASKLLTICKSVEKRMWPFEHPLTQFDLPHPILQKLNSLSNIYSVETIRDMEPMEIGELVHHIRMGDNILRCAEQFPLLIIDPVVAPITRNVMRVKLHVTPNFIWNDRIHGNIEVFWIWVQDPENVEILHAEQFILSKKKMNVTQTLDFVIPIPSTNETVDHLPTQIYVHAINDRWMGAESVFPVSFKNFILPGMNRTPNTNLLNLQPLPVSALHDDVLEEICRKRFDYFNAIQTQIFHTVYWTNNNILVGAPTGSGKTVIAELAMWASFREKPKSKVVYIAPLKALVRERVTDWNKRLTGPMKRNLVELTGDVTPDLKTIRDADIIITTPEKWDGVSRSWKTRKYVKDVALVIIDEIHLLGSDRGPILEVIVSRMNYIASNTDNQIRIVGLSTALANSSDLADWLGINNVGLFNFRHSVRPVPLEIHIDGFQGKHYCPRMQTMNKPTYKAIVTYSPTKPAIVFVSSRRQTRLTAQDIISLCAADGNPRRFLHMPDEEIEMIIKGIQDPSLQYALSFGIGLHHAGLVDSDRAVVEELFVNEKIQILVATSTLAWGINSPAHLVVVKGTEFYDKKTDTYVDFPITDVLQMMGRAGRPQFDDTGIAQIMVQDTKKDFYRKFLHEPFPVESALHKFLHDHMNAEIVSGTISSKQDAIDYLTWTYFYRRLQINPTYYGLDDSSPDALNEYLSYLVEKTLHDLYMNSCLTYSGEIGVKPTIYGHIASFYYLSYKTIHYYKNILTEDYNPQGDPTKEHQFADGDFPRLLYLLCEASEYREHPVRHNEDLLNEELEQRCRISLVELGRSESNFGGNLKNKSYGDPHAKVFILLEAYLSRIKDFPCTDFETDIKAILDNAIRILQAMLEVVATQGFLQTSFGVMNIIQCLKQGLWLTDSTLAMLPYCYNNSNLNHLLKHVSCLPELAVLPEKEVRSIFKKIPHFSDKKIDEVVKVVNNLPIYDLSWKVEASSKNDEPKYAVKNTESKIPILKAGGVYNINITMKRLRPHSDNTFKIYTPEFPKVQHESWWVVLGDEETNELIVLKRLGFAKKTANKTSTDDRFVSLEFVVPHDLIGSQELTIYLISDGYIGLDQQYTFKYCASA